MKTIKRVAPILVIIMLMASLAIPSNAYAFYDTGSFPGLSCRGTLNTTGLEYNGQGTAITRIDISGNGGGYYVLLEASHYVQYTDGTRSSPEAVSGDNASEGYPYWYFTTPTLRYGNSKALDRCISTHKVYDKWFEETPWNGSINVKRGIDW